MTGRKTITIDAELHEALADRKADDESWTDFLERLAETETDRGQAERDVNALTEAHISDIAAATARRTVDEIETLQR